MKKILVVLVCFIATMSTMSTMSIKAQDGNLTEGQWKHGLAVGAQWIAYDLGFGKAEADVIKRTSENYSLDDLRVMYGSKSKWVEYYDKLKAHEGETGNIDKLVSTITTEYKPSIKGQVKKDIEKYNKNHDGNAVQSTTEANAEPAATAATATTGGTNVVAANDTTKAADTKDNGEKESHGGHGFLYFISLLGLALGALGTFLAMQARKENQLLMRDANDDIKNLQQQIDKVRSNQKGQDDTNKPATKRENKAEAKNTNDNLAQAQKIDFNKPVEKNENKPAEKKEEPKEEVKKEEPKKEEPKAAAPAPAFGEPRILFMAKPDENDNFSRSSSAYEPGNSIFELTTMDGKSGSFTVISKNEAQKLALLMPGDALARACSGNNIQSTAGKTRIVTDRAGRAQLENGKWHIVVKAIVHYV
ncbi:MAG: hypothetical protein J6X22_03500 [Muribaculaceae bacterium]|nr:hypothetical protein [Muribaculaceae bacterium]